MQYGSKNKVQEAFKQDAKVKSVFLANCLERRSKPRQFGTVLDPLPVAQFVDITVEGRVRHCNSTEARLVKTTSTSFSPDLVGRLSSLHPDLVYIRVDYTSEVHLR